MWGYILNLFRYATFPSNIKSNMRDYLNVLAGTNKAEAPTLLVYGDYDRLSINAVRNFSRYRDVDAHAQHWLGSRQTILLYCLDDSSELDDNTDLLSIFCSQKNAETPTQIQEYRNFLVITMVTINPDLHNYEDFTHILNQCRKLIEHQMSHGSVQLIEPDDVSYQVYGSFSSSELAIVWSVNQYVDAFRLIEMLRYSAFEYKTQDGNSQQILPFASLYSIVAQPKVASSRFSGHKKIQGSATLKLVFQDGVNDAIARSNFFAEVLGNQCSDSNKNGDEIGQYSVGEYDYSITLPADILCNPNTRLFYRGQALHWAQDKMHMYISSSCVQLHYDVGAYSSDSSDLIVPPLMCQELASVLPARKEDLSEKIKLIKRMIYGWQEEYCSSDCTAHSENDNTDDLFNIYRKKGLRSIIKEKIPETDGLCDSLDLLYTDFVNNCSNLTSTSWSIDLVTQFTSIIDYIANRFYISYQPEQNKDNLFSEIKDICEIYIQMIYHIAQSRRTVFIVPSCHLRYMGQYDMILHAYYGWEKYLLDLAYSLPHQNGVQPILIPILTIDVLPEIRTNIYKIPQHYQPEKRISNIFSINMPLGAMTDFLRYSLTMCHETAHLIIPFDRDQRNQVFGMLFFSELVANLLLSPIQMEFWKVPSVQGDFSRLFPVIKRGLIAVIYNHMRPFFLKHIHIPIMNAYKDKPDTCPPWAEYRLELKEKFVILIQKPAEFSPMLEGLNEYQVVIQQVISETIDNILWDNNQSEVAFLISDNFCDELKTKLMNFMSTPLSTKQRKMFSSFRPLIEIYGGDLCNESYVLSEAYREACQDLFMIRIFQLELVDYLVFIDRQRNDTVTLDQEPPKSEMLRIAMICDYMISSQDIKESPLPTPTHTMPLFDEIAPDYVELFMKTPEMRTKDKTQKARIVQCIKNRFQNIRKGLELYFCDYDIFRPLLLEELKSADLFVQAPEIHKQLMLNGMHQFYDNWKSAILMADDNSKQDIQEMHQKIFSNNIYMIQRYQTQPTFESLALKLERRGCYDGETRSV